MKSIFFNRLPGVIRVAVTHDLKLEHLIYIHDEDPLAVGSIHLGRVSSVVPGIGAAFLDLGGGREAMLDRRDLPELRGGKTAIEAVVKQGQARLVQIKKTAYAGKAAQASASLRLVGFSCILQARDKGVRTSRRYDGSKEMVEDLTQRLDPLHGWIIRSGASGLNAEQVQAEAEVLKARFNALPTSAEGTSGSLWNDGAVFTALKDHFSSGYRGIHFDDEALYNRVRERLASEFPPLLAVIKLHLGGQPMFDVYKIESQIAAATGTRVNLKTGGSLDIRQTEAMVVIDVNSGKGAAKPGAVRRTNREAAFEVARQIRVRNLAGLIVVDFLNGPKGKAPEEDPAKIIRRELARDNAKTDVLPVNRFGLVEITREREHLDLNRALNTRCPACRGAGYVKTHQTRAMDIQVQLMREGESLRGECVKVVCPAYLAAYLNANRDHLFGPIETAFDLTIQVQAESGDLDGGFRLDLA